MGADYNILIVGGGIVGSSVAYHLAKMGAQRVLVLDKGDLAHNDGSTSHAPGGIHVTSPSKMMTDFAVYSTELYGAVPPIDPNYPHFRPVGGIEFATTEARLLELKRRQGIATAFGVEASILDPAECARKVPMLDPRSVLAGLWVPRDANVGGSALTSALAAQARQGGVEFRGDTVVKELLVEGGRVVGVQTEAASITADIVLLCSNIWAPILARQVGIELPLLAAQHQYAVTEPVPELSDYVDREIALPTLRHQDSSLYYRHHKNCWGIGNYRHEPLMVKPEDVGKTALRPFTPKHFEEAWSASCKLFPALNGLELARSFNGMFAFTLDGYPMMGPTSVEGLWTAVGVWITHAGGVGKATAEWILEGAPSTDCREGNVNRFHRFQTSPGYLARRCAKNYAEVYDIHHPSEPLSAPRNLRLTPFHARMQELEAEMVEVSGWEMPRWFGKNEVLLERCSIPARDEWGSRFWSPIQGAEHLAVRESAGLFNLGALAPIEVRGPGRHRFLEKLCSQSIRGEGRVTYTLMLNQLGGVRADLTVAHWADSLWAINGGGLVPRELAWMNSHLPKDGSVHLVDQSSAWTALGLWGPKAREILSKVCDQDLTNDSFPYYHCRELLIAELPVRALRISYAGELGWELYVPTEFGLALWDAIWRVGQEHGLVAAGSGAFDSLRLEKGYRLWGTDMHTEHSPTEVGLDFAVGKKSFLGSGVERPTRSRLVCLALAGEGTLLGGEPVLSGQRWVGYVTSANYGYSVGRFLALAHLELGSWEDLQVQYLGELLDVEEVQDPVFDPKMTRLKA